VRPRWRIAAVTLAAAAAARCAVVPGSGEAAPAFAVTAERGPLSLSVPARGELESTNASPIAVPRVPTGALKVKEIAEEGSVVRPGDIVAVFDETELEIELDNHRAAFRSADRRIEQTDLQSSIETGAIGVMREVAELERDNIRAFESVDPLIYSRREILADRVRLGTAEETILFADASLLLRGEYYDIEERILDVERSQARGKVERVEYSLANLVLRAPIGGLIVYRKNWRGSAVAVGDTLWPGNVIMSIVDPASTMLRAFVLERDAAGLAAEAEAAVTIDARPGRTFPGRVIGVAEISRAIEQGSPVKYCEVRIAVDNDEPELLRPGMKGEARVVTGTLQDAVVIPRSAVRGDAAEPFVLIEAPGGPQRRPVRLGPGDTVQVSVEHGLSGGERVLLGPAPEEASRPPAAAAAASTAGRAARG
jgi:HlyD family secretion protein